MGRALRRLLALGLLCLLAGPGWSAECPAAPQAPSAATLARLRQQAQDHGFLWSIRKAGDAEGRTSWLYGTMHVGRQDWLVPGPRLAAALAASQVLALEMDPLDPDIQRRMAALVAQHAGEWPAALLPRLQRQMQRVCLPPALQQALHPTVLLVTLELYGLRAQGLYSEYAQEAVLSGTARARRVPVVSLETPEAQARVLLGADATVDPEALDAALQDAESGRSATLAAQLARTWAGSDLARLEDYASWCECVATERERRAVRQLLDERNPALADAIDALYQGGQPVLAAVGALHMIGPTGLPGLLRQRGYEVRLLTPSRARAGAAAQ